MNERHILVVDDDERLRNLLLRYLTENGFWVSTASNALEAHALLSFFQIDLIVLDVMMPQESGLQLTKNLRLTSQIPILLLTARGDIEDRIQGLEAGADEYLPKPFEPTELLLRIQAILRRTPSPTLQYFGPFQFDMKNNTLSCQKNIIPLSHSEGVLLHLLLSPIGRPLSRDHLSRHFHASPRAIDVMVLRLRRKLQDDSKTYLQTVRHQGYVLRG